MNFEQKRDRLCLFSENHYGCSVVHRPKRDQVEVRADGGLCLHPGGRWHGWKEGLDSGGSGKVVLHLKVEPTGLVKDCEIFSERGQRVNVLGFSGHTVSVGTTQRCR